jgi:SAM-dependent methyltransferase
MKIIDLLTIDEKSNINKLINSYGKNDEFEISLFSNKETSNNLLTLEKFIHLNSVLSLVTKNEKIQKTSEVTLDVILSIKNLQQETDTLTNYRIQISGIDKINEYMSMLHMRKNHLIFQVLVGFILESKDKNNKITIMKKTKNVSKYVTNEDIYLRVKMDKEEEVTKEEFKKLQTINKNFDMNSYDIIYRYKDRTSYFIEKEKNIYRFDLTNTKKSNKINNIKTSPIKYEIEIEAQFTTKSTVFEQIFNLCEFIIKVIQQSNHIITKSMSNNVINKYKNILGIDASRSHLYGRQPVSLEVQHVVDYIPNRYAVTDKADGDRYFMIIYEKRCYLISSNLIVKDTGVLVDEKFNNSILDGEYIFIPKLNKYLYMAFDCLVLGDKNIREENILMNRLENADLLISSINKLGYSHKYIKNEKIDYNNIDKITEYHKTNIKDFYDDINKELNSKKSDIIFRRKYFIESNGVTDNEIFKYSYMMWNVYTSDKSINCPYLLDGLIFQPLDQKYIVEVEKSKLSDYKWKPPYKNSIDFYIEFEKDKNTNKILTVYDNSFPDVVKNKPYQIANLYVGQNNKGVEKPILFNTKNNISYSMCYIYIDDSGIPRSIDGKQINDKTVVEFYFNNNIDAGNPYKWVPMNTRYDKTESVQKFGKRYGNYSDTALRVWNSIINPILISDFNELSNDLLYSKYMKELKARIDISSIKLEKKQNVYYQKKSKLVENMNSFNNWIKSNVIYTYINPVYDNNIQYKVLDIGCGRGGDILKFYYTMVDTLVGIDPDLEGIVNSSDGAITRYQHIRKSHDNFPPMYFIMANPANLLHYDEQLKIVGRMNQDNKKLMEKFFSYDDTRMMFDRFNASFSIHYLLSDDNSWNNFCENINMYLREGGYFTFVTFDGDRVWDKLKGIDKITEYYDENGEKKVLYEIVKKYNDNDKEKTKERIGFPIDVNMGWISEEGVYQTEYLVFKDFIIKSLKEKCNLELVETGLFEDMYNNNKKFLELGSIEEENIKTKKFYGDVYKFYTPTDINTKCYQYTFLNRFYVFRKVESNLAEIKTKYFTSDRKKIIPGKIANKQNKYVKK